MKVIISMLVLCAPVTSSYGVRYTGDMPEFLITPDDIGGSSPPDSIAPYATESAGSTDANSTTEAPRSYTLPYAIDTPDGKVKLERVGVPSSGSKTPAHAEPGDSRGADSAVGLFGYWRKLAREGGHYSFVIIVGSISVASGLFGLVLAGRFRKDRK